MSLKKALFIINPISGTGKQQLFIDALNKYFDKTNYTHEIRYTEYAGHASVICKDIGNSFDIVVAVGGDGTVNEVAKGLIGCKAAMGIVPVGSGNGLARHLQIPMKMRDALEIINAGKTQKIDTASLNGHHFVNVAGVGFDAHIAHHFAKTKKRGPIEYAKMATLEFQKYQSKEYEVIVEGHSYKLKAFLISFANSSQFGNNAYISPNAIINDGLLDVCLMSNFPKVEAGQLAVKLFNKRLDKSRYMKIIRGKNVIVRSQGMIKAHIDGEPIDIKNEVEVHINQSSLKTIYNDNPKKAAHLDKDIFNLKFTI